MHFWPVHLMVVTERYGQQLFESLLYPFNAAWSQWSVIRTVPSFKEVRLNNPSYTVFGCQFLKFRTANMIALSINTYKNCYCSFFVPYSTVNK